MESEILLGHYWHNAATCYARVTLIPMDNDEFNRVIKYVNTIEQFEGKTVINGNANPKYKKWKAEHLPLLFFVNNSRRPSADDTACCPSGYACVDIDNLPNTRIDITHPAVQFVNYTRKGAHIYIYSPSLLTTSPLKWQDAYNRIAITIYDEIRAEHHDVKFDGRLSQITWGCYIWGGKWVMNRNASYDYTAGDILVTDEDISRMYTGYIPAKAGVTIKRVNNKGNMRVTCEEEAVESTANGKTWTEALISLGVDAGMLNDFNHLPLAKFIHKYYGKYEPIHEAKPVYQEYECYDGSVCEAAILGGQLPKTWRPYDPNDKVKKGKRRHTLYNHLVKAKQQLTWLASDENTRAEKEGYDPNRLLFDAAHFSYCFFEYGKEYDKNKIRRCLHGALIYIDSEDRKSYDKRNISIGKMGTDTETGEYREIGTRDKIRNAPKVNKTERMKLVLKQCRGELALKENIVLIQTDGVGGTDSLSERTIKDYLKRAKTNPKMLKEYPWLASVEFSGNKKAVTIRNRHSGETRTFKTVKECCETLGISEKTYHTKFKKGKGDSAKDWEVVDDLGRG